MNKHILIVGGRSQARSLAESLINKKYRVTIINDDYDYCTLLTDIDKLNIIHGDGSKPYVLEDANVATCDIAIVLGDHDTDNLIICELCQHFGVKKTVAVVNDPKKTDFFYKMGVSSVVCANNAITSIIEQQAIMDELATVVPIGEGRVRLTEVVVPDESPIIGKRLAEIGLPQHSVIGCILRGDASIVPRGDTTVERDDTLLLISSSDDEPRAIRIITGR